jgi:sporulation protein YlmC with PRC-barrel domain
MQTPAAQSQSSGASAKTGKSAERSDRITVAAAHDILGDPVRDKEGKDLGSVEYLMIGVNDGQARYAIVEPASGTDDQLVPVPWNAVHASGTATDRNLTVDRERFGKQQKISEDKIGGLTQPAMITSIYEYWAPVGQQGGAQESQAKTSKQKESGKEAGAAQGSPHFLVGRDVITTVLAPSLRTTDELRGSEVYSADKQEYGEIDDVIIDLDGGRIAYLQIGHGGFLGLGEEITPVPYEALSYDHERNAYRLGKSEAELEKIQSFARGDQPSWIKASDLGKLYKDFGVQPYWHEKT